MIGRFSKRGVYQELFRLRDFYLAASAALLALAGFIVDYGSPTAGWLGNLLAIISVAINAT
jgi:Cd2+/Zn2+-exporting ATPase